MFRRFILFLVLPLFLFSLSASAQFTPDVSLLGGLNALKVGVPFLLIAPDSRAGSMGDVGVASTPDVNSQHWNPAKYAFIDNEWGVGLSYTPWLRNLINDINLTYVSGFHRFDDQQVVSATLLYFSLGSITFTNDQGEFQQTHNANEFAFDAAYSRKFSERISGSLAFRFIRSDLTGGFSQQGQPDAKPGNAVSADISTYYQAPIVIDDKDGEFALGLNISNIGTKISYNDEKIKDFIPINMRLGGRITLNFDPYNAMSFMLDGNKLLVPTPPIYQRDENGDDVLVFGMDPDVAVTMGILQSFYDAPGGFKEELSEISIAAGIEYVYAKQFAIRAGYFDEHANKGNRKYFTLGAGLKYNVFNLDFAYLIPRAGQTNPLANTVRFTIGFDFESSGKKKNRRK